MYLIWKALLVVWWKDRHSVIHLSFGEAAGLNGDVLDQINESFDRLKQEMLQLLQLRGRRHGEEHLSVCVAVLNCFLLDNRKLAGMRTDFTFQVAWSFSAYTIANWKSFSLTSSFLCRRSSWCKGEQSPSTLFIGLAGVEFLVWGSPSRFLVVLGPAQETVCVGWTLDNRAKLHARWREVGRYNGSVSAPPPTRSDCW